MSGTASENRPESSQDGRLEVDYVSAFGVLALAAVSGVFARIGTGNMMLGFAVAAGLLSIIATITCVGIVIANKLDNLKT